ncbi:hypothetical protein [Marinobacter sp. tcs-11]|uniref:hypothetical protein n=1 Tax=Marinobacter sp. tcs-11 TaxID=1742860 RepID=UPI00257A6775|nr:hypothetical protein [Marinobacter sp. tcs-11]
MASEEIERDFDRQKRIGIIIGLFVVAVAGIASWLSRPQEGQSNAVDVHSAPAASFKAHYSLPGDFRAHCWRWLGL